MPVKRDLGVIPVADTVIGKVYIAYFQCRIMVLAALFVPCFLQVMCFWNRDIHPICSTGSFISESYIWLVLGLVLFVKKLWLQ